MGRTAVMNTTTTSGDFKLFSIQNQNNHIKKGGYSINNAGNTSVTLNNVKRLEI